MEKERLFKEFQPVTSEDWKNKIIEDLKGADYDKKMIWKTSEGFCVNPFYRKEDLPAGCTDEQPGKFPYTRGNRDNNCWLIRQEINIADATEANTKAKKIIAEGVEDEKQVSFLSKNGCNIIQGFIISKAIKVDECIKLIEGYNVTKTL